ncbi:MAG TPA: acyl carrier protein [Streptosporangiaceae bacterium]|nr:acyl carrier protein [Streptosporangiaceae bacterium]
MSMPSPRPDGPGSRPVLPGPGRAAGPTAGEVTSVIEEILEISQMAADENFFEVGGSSILALTLISRIEQRWAATLSLTDVIRNATPVLLADLIAKAAPGPDGVSPPGGLAP